jgi:hypothetical protein
VRLGLLPFSASSMVAKADVTRSILLATFDGLPSLAASQNVYIKIYFRC